jgi:hypothetical protein
VLGAKGALQLSVCDRIGEGPRSRATRRPVEPGDSPSQWSPRQESHSALSAPIGPDFPLKVHQLYRILRINPARVAHLDRPGRNRRNGWHRDPPVSSE